MVKLLCVSFILFYQLLFYSASTPKETSIYNLYLLSCAGNCIKPNKWKEHCCRARKYPMYAKRKIPIELQGYIRLTTNISYHLRSWDYSLPVRTLITYPSIRATYKSTSYKDENQGNNVYSCNSGLCQRTLHD